MNDSSKPSRQALWIAVSALSVLAVFILVPLLLPKQTGASFTFLVLGLGIIGWTGWLERNWRKKFRTGQVLPGRITSCVSEGSCIYPIVKFEWHKETIEFTSKFDHTRKVKPRDVRVVYDAKTGEAELLTMFTRWYWIVFLGLFGGLFMLGGLFGMLK